MSVDHTFDGAKAEAALEILDAKWYREVAKRGRWMDLIGDYAGNERFVLDGGIPIVMIGVFIVHPFFAGDALLQNVLDDPLLALGRENGTHACLHATLMDSCCLSRSQFPDSACVAFDGTIIGRASQTCCRV